MAPTRHLTAVIKRECDGSVALCPDLDIASQGSTIEESQRDLREALKLIIEVANPLKLQVRLHSEGMRSDVLQRDDL
jgi:predicted RNase H-like HicB family nuclease